MICDVKKSKNCVKMFTLLYWDDSILHVDLAVSALGRQFSVSSDIGETVICLRKFAK